jgi:hypothetical protein
LDRQGSVPIESLFYFRFFKRIDQELSGQCWSTCRTNNRSVDRPRRSCTPLCTRPQGLGSGALTVRTTLGLPSPLAVLGKSSGLPKLPQIALSLYIAQPEPPQAVARLREILIEELPLRG